MVFHYSLSKEWIYLDFKLCPSQVIMKVLIPTSNNLLLSKHHNQLLVTFLALQEMHLKTIFNESLMFKFLIAIRYLAFTLYLLNFQYINCIQQILLQSTPGCLTVLSALSLHPALPFLVQKARPLIQAIWNLLPMPLCLRSLHLN